MSKNTIPPIAQHTPGPWRLDTPEPDGEIIVMDEQDVSVATCWKQPLDPDVWVESNARLIAAAPDLLDAAELVVARWERGDLAEAVRELSAAVAKAKAGAA